MDDESDLTCPVARTLVIIGDRWTILILRDLFQRGPRKFADLETSLSGVSPKTLSDRLKRLTAAGILEQKFYSMHPPRAEYVLTSKGRELGPIVKTMRDWGTRHT
jgi:DNA-binding HxlR family transcriptional regulator